MSVDTNDFRGLINEGNDCYVNSNMQLLKVIYNYIGYSAESTKFYDIYF